MSGDTRAEQPSEVPKWVTAGAAVLGSFFVYFALGLGVGILAVLHQNHQVQSGNYGGLQLLLVLAILAALAALAGGGLRWIARRYQSATVQAGALVGAGAMTLVYFFSILFDPGFGGETFILVFLLGLGLLVVVAPLAANPSRAPGERTGIDTLWLSLSAGSRRLVDGMTAQSDKTGDTTSKSTDSRSDGSTDSYRPVSVSRYWLVVGSAFVVFVPIAFVRPALGVGLLSAFLTAYTFSKQIEAESTDTSTEKSSRDE